MSLPLAQMICGLPSPINPSHASTLRQSITDDTFILNLIQQKNPPKHDAETLQIPPGSSSRQHQAQYLQAIHGTIQQFHQRLKAEKLDRKTLQLIFLQLQKYFAILRYLLFFSVGTLPISDTSVEDLATSPLIHLNLTLILTLNPLQLLSYLLVLMNQNFVVLPQSALWDHTE